MKHLSLRSALSARSLLAAAALCLVAPAASNAADIPITNFKAGPVPTFNLASGLPVTSGNPSPAANDVTCMHINPAAPVLSTQAGATTDYCINFSVTPGDAITGNDIKNTLVQLPVGTQASIDNASKCSEAAFSRDSIAPNTCPGASQVGTALSQLQTPALPNPATDRAVQQAPGRIYALDVPHRPGDRLAAKFGVALISSAPSASAPTTPVTESKFVIEVTQLGDPSVGLQNQTDSLAKVAGGTTPIAIQATSLRFWGSAAAHPHVTNPFAPTAPVTMASDFFIVGTTCGTPQTAKLTVNPWTDTAASADLTPSNASTTYNLTGCDSLPFNPTFSVGTSGETAVGGHPQLDIKLGSPQGDEDIGGTKITLPLGIATDLSRVQNACPIATFTAGGCSAATVIGSVKATLTGIDADVVAGDVQMVKVDGQVLPALGFDFKGRLPLRVSGVTSIDASGRIVNTFSNLPSLPERTVDVTLFGGTRGILQVSSAKCQASSFNGDVIGQNGKVKSFSFPTKCGETLVASIKKSDSARPTISVSGAGATGKQIGSIRITLPSGLTINRDKIRSGSKIDKLSLDVTGRTTRVRLDKKTMRFSIPKPGSNGLRILTRTGTLGASTKFAKRTGDLTVLLRVVYTDGSKANVTVPLARK